MTKKWMTFYHRNDITMEDMTFEYKAMPQNKEGMTYIRNVILPGAVWLYSLATTLHLAWLYQRKSFGWALYDFLSHKQASHTHNRECLDRGHGMTF